MKKVSFVLFFALMLSGFVGKAQLNEVLIFNKATGKGLMMQQVDGKYVNDALILIKNESQYWNIKPVGNGLYGIHWASNNMFMSIRMNESCDVDVNAWIPQGQGIPQPNAPHRCWRIKDVGDGWYEIENGKAGCVMTDENGSLFVRARKGTDNQKWQFQQQGARLRPKF